MRKSSRKIRSFSTPCWRALQSESMRYPCLQNKPIPSWSVLHGRHSRRVWRGGRADSAQIRHDVCSIDGGHRAFGTDCGGRRNGRRESITGRNDTLAQLAHFRSGRGRRRCGRCALAQSARCCGQTCAGAGDKVIDWLKKYRNATPAQFEAYLRDLYKTDNTLNWRFPNGF